MKSLLKFVAILIIVFCGGYMYYNIGADHAEKNVTTQLHKCTHAPQPVIIGDTVYLIKCDSLTWSKPLKQ